tara:strand:- start:58 stop:1323 length:1266 start_codon:yes stop_codon:yes gene_type:complete
MVTAIVVELGHQFLNGGMARMPQATHTLAAFGLAWGIKDFLGSPVWQGRQLGLVLADSQQARRKLQRFAVLFALPFSLLLVALGATPLGHWVIGDMHEVEVGLSKTVMVALLWVAPLPILEGLMRFYSGLLLRVRRTDLVSYATILSIGASIAAVFVLLPTEMVCQGPIRLPLAVLYIGFTVNFAILLWGYRRYVHLQLPEEGEALTYGQILRFFWPLGLVLAIQGLSRPLINLFISRGSDATEALAILAVLYPLGMLPYAWINEMRSLPAAFKDVQDSLYYIRRFMGVSSIIAFLVAVLLFWTPLRDFLLGQLIGLDGHLASLCKSPAILLAFFPFVVSLRAYSNGVALVERRTAALAPSAPLRIGVIALALWGLQIVDIHGATRGIAALLCGFVMEAAAMWWWVIGVKLVRGYKVSGGV